MEPKRKFDIKNAKITSVWCQNYNLTQKVSKACNIKNPVRNYKDMLNNVDAVIIARDDWKSHIKLSSFFIRNKIKVFIDKPLTLSKKELIFFLKIFKIKINNVLFSSTDFQKNLKKIKI